MHYCANIVTGDVGDGQAVLLRALLPIVGIEEMVRRRGREKNLTDGPGKLCHALGIDITMNGSVLDGAAGVQILDDGTPPPDVPRVGPRIGITKGVDTAWRWRV
jgi:DNA-3-methyladenine glycosylase